MTAREAVAEAVRLELLASTLRPGSGVLWRDLADVALAAIEASGEYIRNDSQGAYSSAKTGFTAKLPKGLTPDSQPIYIRTDALLSDAALEAAARAMWATKGSSGDWNKEKQYSGVDYWLNGVRCAIAAAIGCVKHG